MDRLVSEISVFLPVYNEAEIIEKVISHTVRTLKNIADKWELIIVNDGSQDATHQIINKLAEENTRIRVVNHEKNLGYGASLADGFYAASYKWIAFTDSDGQFDFSEIKNFLTEQAKTDADLVIGYYKKRQVSAFKILTSKAWEMSVFLLTGLKVRDIDCGFKLISKKVIDTIPHLESQRGAFISSELLIKAKKKGFKIEQIPVTHYPRTRGVGTGRNLNVIIKSYIDLFKLWKKLG